MHRYILFAGALLLVTGSNAQVEVEQLVVRPGERIENVIETEDGSLYFTGALNSEVLRLTPRGRVEVFVDSISFRSG